MENQKTKPYVTWGIIGVNILYFLYLDFSGSSEDVMYMLEHGAMYVPYVLAGEYFRLLTSIFMHFGISHLVNNMLILFILGDYLEREMGRIRYLLFYLLCGIGANLISVAWGVFWEAQSGLPVTTVSAGASGAIFGVAGGLFAVVVANRGRLKDLSARQIGIMVLLSLYLGFRSAETDNLAHVAGAAIGFVLGAVFYRPPSGQRKNKGQDLTPD